MTGTHLPSALAAWSEQLSALRPEVAVALGPMLHRLDELVGRHSSVDGPEGLPDGLGGLARRGDPTRLLASEWALAQDVPEEFVRRAASGELLYLAQARIHPPVRGQTVLLVDCGPDLHGAPRLVQLAMALVLHRRAAAVGSQFRLGVLASPAGSWPAGDLPAVLQAWLRARSRRPATLEDLQAWTSVLDDPQHAWAVAPAALARAAAVTGGRSPRLVTAEESDWVGSGPTAVLVGLAGERVHLPLPASNAAIRVLRGEGWRRQSEASTRTAASRANGARLPGVAPILLARGRDAQEVVVQRVPEPGAPAGRVRAHHFAGPVLAASRLGTRLVALVAVDGTLETRVIGKRLADVEQISVPLAELELDPAGVAFLTTAPPEEVFFRSGDLLVRLGGRWWELSAGRPPAAQPTLAAVAPSTTLDAPIVAVRAGRQLWVWAGGQAGRFGPVPTAGPVPQTHVGAGAIAWQDAGTWRIAELPCPLGRASARAHTQPPDGGMLLSPDEGATVVGVTRIGGEAGLVTVGSAGLLVKFVTGQGTRALTRWSGGVAPPALHARLPLLAVHRDGGVIEVGDLDSGRVRLRLETAR